MKTTKDIHVNRLGFVREFLDSIIAFNKTNEFLPIYIHNGKLVTVCSLSIQGNAGSIGLCVEHSLLENNIDDGEVFYIQDPVKLKKLAMIASSDRLHIRFTKNQLIAVGGDLKFTCNLYDPMLASKTMRFWKPEKFDKFKTNIQKGTIIDQETLGRIHKIISATDDDLATITTYDGSKDFYTLSIGDTDSFSGGINIAFDGSKDCLNDGTVFNKNVFNVMRRGDITFSETTDGNIVVLKEQTELTTKYCIITKIRKNV